MRKLFILLAILIVLAIAAFIYQNNPANILSKIEATQLKTPAKQLCYRVYLFGIFPVGKAILEDNGLVRFENKDIYRLSAQAQSFGFVSKVYPFSTIIDSYLDTKTYLPMLFRQNSKTKDKEVKKEVRYDQIKNIMEIAGEKRSIFPETYEPLSALYKLRRLDLEKTSNFDLNINTNQKNYAFTGSIVKENIPAQGGERQAYRLKGKIFRRDKNPYHQSQVEFVLLGNEQKTPLFIKVFASGALITVRLVDK